MVKKVQKNKIFYHLKLKLKNLKISRRLLILSVSGLCDASSRFWKFWGEHTCPFTSPQTPLQQIPVKQCTYLPPIPAKHNPAGGGIRNYLKFSLRAWLIYGKWDIQAYNNKLQRREMWSVEAKEEEVQSSVQAEDAKAEDLEAIIQVKKEEQAKNRKWPEVVHAKYILFLELNREKIKSKLIRRSNSFYNEMSLFIKDKTGVQCRSHHQKFELRYKYPHRIIRQEKLKISEVIYNQVKAAFTNVEGPSHFNSITNPAFNPNSTNNPKVSPKMKTISCQTELQGVDKAFVNPQQLNDYYYWMNQYYNYSQPSPPQLMMQWTAATHFPQMGSPYFNGTF